MIKERSIFTSEEPFFWMQGPVEPVEASKVVEVVAVAPAEMTLLSLAYFVIFSFLFMMLIHFAGKIIQSELSKIIKSL